MESRDSGGFSTRLDGLESPQRVTKSSRSNLSSRTQESTKEKQIQLMERQKTHEIDSNSKPRRAQEGKGLLSRSIHVQSLHQSMAKIPNSREVKRWTGRRGAPGGGEVACCSFLRQGKRRDRERKGVRGVFNPNNSHPKRLHYL